MLFTVLNRSLHFNTAEAGASAGLAHSIRSIRLTPETGVTLEITGGPIFTENKNHIFADQNELITSTPNGRNYTREGNVARVYSVPGGGRCEGKWGEVSEEGAPSPVVCVSISLS